eukprot:symbB.v1.2.023889.t1/scaffold2222.1/size85392/5
MTLWQASSPSPAATLFNEEPRQAPSPKSSANLRTRWRSCVQSLPQSERERLKKEFDDFIKFCEDRRRNAASQNVADHLDHLRTLGLDGETSFAEVKQRFRQLALQTHPDKCQDDGERFKEIKAAYEALEGFFGKADRW